MLVSRYDLIVNVNPIMLYIQNSNRLNCSCNFCDSKCCVVPVVRYHIGPVK